MRYCLIVLLLYSAVLHSQVAWKAPSSYASLKNPVVYNDASIGTGKLIYRKNCASCHGTSGKGNGIASPSLNPKPADHTSQKFQQQSDGDIFWKIKSGRGAMPAWGNSLSKKELWSIVNYIRSFDPDRKVKQQLAIDTIHVKQDSLPVKDQTTGTDSLFVKKIDSLDRKFSQHLFNLNIKTDSMLMENENLKAEVRNSSKQGKKKFLATGSANTLMSLNTDSWNEYGFSAGFLPLFLWKPADKLFFESHFHVEGHAVEAGHSHGSVATTSLYSEANISLAYANLSWLISKYVILNAGYFPTPFGIYNERMHPEWINKLADSPLGSGHDRTVGPSKELGVQLRGSFKVQNSRLNYALYASNGPQLDYTSGNAGMLLFGSVLDNNFNKAIGGRVGFLPLNRSDFEVGVSVQVAKVGDKATLYEHLGARMYAVDMSFNLKAETVKGVFNFKSQLAYTSVDNANYTLYPDARIVAPAPIVLHNGTDTITYYYINTSHAGFAILSFRPSLSQKSFLSRLEIVGRFDEITLPKNAFWTLSDRRWTIALDYWLEPRSVLKFVYEIGQYKDFAMVQFVIGF